MKTFGVFMRPGRVDECRAVGVSLPASLLASLSLPERFSLTQRLSQRLARSHSSRLAFLRGGRRACQLNTNVNDGRTSPHLLGGHLYTSRTVDIAFSTL
jgi:hypothetical protein